MLPDDEKVVTRSIVVETLLDAIADDMLLDHESGSADLLWDYILHLHQQVQQDEESN